MKIQKRIVVLESSDRIRFKKGSLVFLALAALVITALSVALIVLDVSYALVPPIVFKAVGLVGAVTFGFFALTIIKKMLSSKPGIQFTQQGIIDYSSAYNIGLIEWSDIVRVDELDISGQPTVYVIVQDPSKYIGKVANPLKKWAYNWNLRNGGSPIALSARSLEVEHADLVNILRNQVNAHTNPR